MAEDGLYLEDETGNAQRVGFQNPDHDRQVLEQAKQEGKYQALLTQQEINQSVAQAEQIAGQRTLQRTALLTLERHPELQKGFGPRYFETELAQQRWDQQNDPDGRYACAQAAERTRQRLHDVTMKDVEIQQAETGNALVNGKLYEGGAPLQNVPVEEPANTGNSYVDQRRAKCANIRRTFANTGEV